MVGIFGGALQVSLPGHFVDVSTLRQVPDNQEVYVDSTSDMSLIIELLETPDDVETVPAVFHFQELAECNSATESSTILSTVTNVSGMIAYSPILSYLSGSRASYSKVRGTQCISKYSYQDQRKRQSDVVDIFLGVIRLPQTATDLTLSVNIPHDTGSKLLEVEKIFEEAFSSISVCDWTIFEQ
ncbi:MAG: hypothetical protein SGCHY_000165 [Lobulomycetales sp.]